MLNIYFAGAIRGGREDERPHRHPERVDWPLAGVGAEVVP